MEKSEQMEFEAVSKAAILSVEIAAMNISKFIGLAGEGGAHQRMRTYDDMLLQTSKVVDESVKAAEINLQAYLELKKTLAK